MKCGRPKIIYRIIKLADSKNIGSKSKKRIFDNPKFNVPPKFIAKKYEIDSLSVSGRNSFTIEAGDSHQTHIVFLHGGAYRYPSTFFHWVLLDNLLKKIPCKATFVDYPLAPQHKCKDNVSTVMEIYKNLFDADNKEKIILMGDSAGGGLALVMAQIIKEKNIHPKPTKIVMISPWLDISMETEIPEELQECDFMLNRDKLKENGKEYAGDLDTKNPLCSPYYGDSKDIGEIALFMGTRDILYVDALRFKKKAQKENYDLTFYEYKGMQHDWVLFPIDDAKDALAEIVKFIKK